MTPLAMLSVLLLLAGVAGAAVPRVPGMPATLGGVYLYWWTTGYTEPSNLMVVTLTLVGVTALASAIVADAASARIGNASKTTMLGAGVVGSVLLVFTGPLAMVLGTTVTAFVLEYRRQRTVRAGARAAAAIVVSSFGSRIFRLAIAVLILLVMVAIILT